MECTGAAPRGRRHDSCEGALLRLVLGNWLGLSRRLRQQAPGLNEGPRNFRAATGPPHLRHVPLGGDGLAWRRQPNGCDACLRDLLRLVREPRQPAGPLVAVPQTTALPIESLQQHLFAGPRWIQVGLVAVLVQAAPVAAPILLSGATACACRCRAWRSHIQRKGLKHMRGGALQDDHRHLRYSVRCGSVPGTGPDACDPATWFPAP